MEQEARLVVVVVQEPGLGGLAVATGTSGLLVVLLDGGGQVEVNHGAHVGLVNAHTEGVGGHDDGRISGHPGVLLLLLDFRTQAGVVVVGGNALAREGFGYLGGLLAGANVYNRWGDCK